MVFKRFVTSLIGIFLLISENSDFKSGEWIN